MDLISQTSIAQLKYHLFKIPHIQPWFIRNRPIIAPLFKIKFKYFNFFVSLKFQDKPKAYS